MIKRRGEDRGIALTFAVALLGLAIMAILCLAYLTYVETRLAVYVKTIPELVVGLSYPCMIDNVTPSYASTCIRDNIVNNIPILGVECNCTFRRIVEKVYEWTITEPFRECTCILNNRTRIVIVLYLHMDNLEITKLNNMTIIAITLESSIESQARAYACGREITLNCTYYITNSPYRHVMHCITYLPCVPNSVKICIYGLCINMRKT